MFCWWITPESSWNPFHSQVDLLVETAFLGTPPAPGPPERHVHRLNGTKEVSATVIVHDAIGRTCDRDRVIGLTQSRLG